MISWAILQGGGVFLLTFRHFLCTSAFNKSVKNILATVRGILALYGSAVDWSVHLEFAVFVVLRVIDVLEHRI